VITYGAVIEEPEGELGAFPHGGGAVVEVEHGAGGGGEGVALGGGAAAGDVDGHGFGWVLFEPLCDAYGVDGGGGLWWCCGGVHGGAAGFEDFGAEGGAEFEVVEVFGEGFGVDGLEFEFWGCVGEVKVFDHFGELSVEFYLVDAFPEVGADDAFDGVGVVEEVGEVSVLDDPFGGGFFAFGRRDVRIVVVVSAVSLAFHAIEDNSLDGDFVF